MISSTTRTFSSFSSFLVSLRLTDLDQDAILPDHDPDPDPPPDDDDELVIKDPEHEKGQLQRDLRVHWLNFLRNRYSLDDIALVITALYVLAVKYLRAIAIKKRWWGLESYPEYNETTDLIVFDWDLLWGRELLGSLTLESEQGIKGSDVNISRYK
ncbi:hypothetical protein H072_151 [Dactylellina haptotyla CBS 200.50]|uniref:Uncharacterized protein n=1 Tax=Dactylellina haptotyla (strain CBS 200.50) TaxID=1284197 RepID=S8CDD3_DACHA|nr:hypothetical protein H072_151 [Dactylellina haptotyla CBS 200.50]